MFLKRNGKCLIHEVKPLDCKLYPFTFDYDENSKSFVYYIGNCNAILSLKKTDKLLDFIRFSKTYFLDNISKCKEYELIAYSNYLHVKNLKVIK